MRFHGVYKEEVGCYGFMMLDYYLSCEDGRKQEEEDVIEEHTINLQKCHHGCLLKMAASEAIKDIRKFALLNKNIGGEVSDVHH